MASFAGDFCSGLKCIGVVDEKTETNKCSFFSLQYNFQCAILVSRVVNDLSIGNESYDVIPIHPDGGGQINDGPFRITFRIPADR